MKDAFTDYYHVLDFVFLILFMVFLLVCFLYVKNNLISLLLLLIMTLICSVVVWKVFLFSFPVLIYLVPTSTGLYVMFSYIISVDTKNKIKEPKISIFCFLSSTFFPLVLSYFFVSKTYLQETSFPFMWMIQKFTPYLGYQVVVLMIVIFLILMIIFIIWMIKSKGGGAREM
nr:NADH dehydrogenase subunit 6 [Actornithophilus hoplopteri]